MAPHVLAAANQQQGPARTQLLAFHLVGRTRNISQSVWSSENMAVITHVCCLRLLRCWDLPRSVVLEYEACDQAAHGDALMCWRRRANSSFKNRSTHMYPRSIVRMLHFGTSVLRNSARQAGQIFCTKVPLCAALPVSLGCGGRKTQKTQKTQQTARRSTAQSASPFLSRDFAQNASGHAKSSRHDYVATAMRPSPRAATKEAAARPEFLLKILHYLGLLKKCSMM